MRTWIECCEAEEKEEYQMECQEGERDELERIRKKEVFDEMEREAEIILEDGPLEHCIICKGEIDQSGSTWLSGIFCPECLKQWI